MNGGDFSPRTCLFPTSHFFLISPASYFLLLIFYFTFIYTTCLLATSPLLFVCILFKMTTKKCEVENEKSQYIFRILVIQTFYPVIFRILVLQTLYLDFVDTI